MGKIILKSSVLKSVDRFKDCVFPDYPMLNGQLDKDKIIDILRKEEYGYIEDDGLTFTVEEVESYNEAIAGKATHILFKFIFTKDGKESSFPVNLFYPNEVKNVPLIVHINFFKELPSNRYLFAEELIDDGVAVAHICYTDITSDDGNFNDGLSSLIVDRKKPLSAGKISVWAYALIKVGEYLLNKGYTTSENLFVAGHSRLGKTALWAAAQSDIFKGVLSNCSGCGGAAVFRGKSGETIKLITDVFPFWFVPGFDKNSNKEKELIFDQHFLLGLICPRKLCVVAAEKDTWADTDAQYLCVELASNVYEFYGLKGLMREENIEYGQFNEGGNVCFSKRKGTHYLSRSDWEFFIRNIKR